MASIISAGTTSGTALNMAGDTSGVLQLATNGSTTAVTVDASQNVGIGTASPATKLHIISGVGVDPLRLQSTLSGSERAWTIGPNVGADGIFAIRDTTANANRLSIDTSGNLQFNSGYGSAATAYGCRAWVNFNGTGTPAIRASGNVTSITDNGTGAYTLNFTNAMPDVNYSPIVSLGLVEAGTSGRGRYAGFNNQGGTVYSPSTNNIRMLVASTVDGTSQSDCDFIYVAIFR